MKIPSLREHYNTTDGGVTWLPKAAFSSEKEARNKGFSAAIWGTYTCGECNKIHLTKIRDKDDE